MVFDAPRLRVALATVHIPLAAVPQAVADGSSILAAARRLAALLRAGYGLRRPRLAVLGLNPHAGEGGLLGAEEQACVLPAIEKLRGAGLDVIGPLPPDTAFIAARRAEIDGYIALYHDQGLIPVKTLSFEEAIQLTLGLPFIRTSVAHGTGFDRVGRPASAASLLRALAVASELAERWPAVIALDSDLQDA
jgi:4-hydroxythreonine-4-phosphate dehydrogenase